MESEDQFPGIMRPELIPCPLLLLAAALVRLNEFQEFGIFFIGRDFFPHFFPRLFSLSAMPNVQMAFWLRKMVFPAEGPASASHKRRARAKEWKLISIERIEELAKS